MTVRLPFFQFLSQIAFLTDESLVTSNSTIFNGNFSLSVCDLRASPFVGSRIVAYENRN
jgi:hypothetical protein